MVLAMRHGVLGYEAMGLKRLLSLSSLGVFNYEATRLTTISCKTVDFHERFRHPHIRWPKSLNPPKPIYPRTSGGADAKRMKNNSLSDMSDYYLLDDQNPVGPFPFNEIVRMQKSGNFHESDYIWRDGMPEWITIAEIFSTTGEIGQLTIQSPTLDDLVFRPTPPPLPRGEDHSGNENDSEAMTGAELPLFSNELRHTISTHENHSTGKAETATPALHADERILFIGKHSKSFNDTFFVVGCLASLLIPITIPIVIILILVLRPFQKSRGKLTITNHRIIEEILHADKSRSVRVVPLRNVSACRVLGSSMQWSRFFVGDVCISYSADGSGSSHSKTFRNLKNPFRVAAAISNAARSAKSSVTN